MTETGRACIFCGQRPVTKEHAWPRWLCERFKKQAFTVVDANGRQRDGVGIEFTVKRVCAVCNNGWMSRLEVAAQPVIAAMVEGTALTFDDENRTAFVAWCVKTSMLMEHTLARSSGIYYTAEERVVFRHPPHVPPEETTVSVAHYPNGQALRAGFRGSEIGARSVSGELWAPARRFSLVFGQMAVRVESNRWQQVHKRGLLQWPDKLWAKSIHPWPLGYGPQDWPHAEKLTDDEVKNGW